MTTHTALKKLYEDPTLGLTSKSTFLKNLKDRGIKYNQKAVDELFQDASIQLSQPVRKNFERRPVIVLRVDETWGCDLSFLPQFKRYNDGYSILLFVIDFLSKYLWVRPLKDAKAKGVSEALEEIMKSSGREPERINVDGGGEFKKETLAMLKEKDIAVYQSWNTTKVPIVERVIRTIKGRISRYQDATGSYRYIDALQKIVRGYNSSRHSTIKMTPNQASKPENYLRLVTNFFDSIKPRKEQKQLFDIGDVIRVSIQKDKFAKESDGNFTLETFVVSKVLNTLPITYKIRDKDGEEIKGSFYSQEMIKVGKKEADNFRKDAPKDLDTVKVLKTRVVRKQPQSYVEYSDGTKAWVVSSDIITK
eukprot:Lithocolla_globosa_v1_NODE_1406_length_2601_cov_198.602121.p1 type:complete len:363 gc:universal NODE_1406_length_2601_cov_198.602121:1458-2546(+)